MKAALRITVFPYVIFAACLLLLSQAAHAGIAGNVQFVNGHVQITNAVGQARTLQKGDAVHESDTLTTAKDSSAQIRMRDGGLIAVRPDSQLRFDSFVFTGKQDGNEKSFFSLLSGGFRAITGLIGQKNKANYRIFAGTSSIGIRGTDHETFVVVPGSKMAAIAPVGTYNKVNVGETTLTTDKGTINILPNQMGFAADGQMPQLQPVNLNIFTVVPSPALQTGRGQTEGAVRGSTVVDNVIQEQSIAPENAVPKAPTLRPITENRGTTAPPRVF